MRRATNNINSSVHAADISIHALLAESDGFSRPLRATKYKFLSTLSLRRATSSTLIIGFSAGVFLSTLSLRRATPVRDVIQWEGIFLSTLSLRRATPLIFRVQPRKKISIHALLAESDSQVFQRIAKPFRISIHALLAESDRLSRHLVGVYPYFYPRSPCGERLWVLRKVPLLGIISIHALLAESDSERPETRPSYAISIHALLAESDHYDNFNLHCVEISIHALLAESDIVMVGLLMFSLYFYPRSPCGERRHLSMCNTSLRVFLSTLSLRRATSLNLPSRPIDKNISIHALLAESDNTPVKAYNIIKISIHALLAESD